MIYCYTATLLTTLIATMIQHCAGARHRENFNWSSIRMYDSRRGPCRNVNLIALNRRRFPSKIVSHALCTQEKREVHTGPRRYNAENMGVVDFVR